MKPGEIIIYQNKEGNISIDMRLQDETVWLTQEQMAVLFGKDSHPERKSQIAGSCDHIYQREQADIE